MSLSTALSNQRGEAETIFRRAARRRAQEALRIASLERHIARLDNEIARRIDGDEVLVTRYRILLSIEGGGPVAAITLLVCLAGLDEIGLCSGKAAAMLQASRRLPATAATKRVSATFAAAAPMCEPPSPWRRRPRVEVESRSRRIL